MKNNDKLTSQEILDILTRALRELDQNEVSSRNMPNIINRGRAAAQIVTAIHREEIMEARRQAALQLIDHEQEEKIKKLKKKD